MPSRLCQEYLERAERYERLADAFGNSNLTPSYLELARQWRELAEKADQILPSAAPSAISRRISASEPQSGSKETAMQSSKAPCGIARGKSTL